MSTKSTAEKLLVKPGTTFWSSDRGNAAHLGPLPADVRVVDALRDATVAVIFVESAESAHSTLEAQADDLAAPDVLWVAYPKGNRADVNRDTLWPIVAGHGMRPIAQVSLDDVWSALRFRPLGPGEAPFTGGRRA